MKNILILFALFSFAITSCSSYENFSKRKYLDFAKGSQQDFVKAKSSTKKLNDIIVLNENKNQSDLSFTTISKNESKTSPCFSLEKCPIVKLQTVKIPPTLKEKVVEQNKKFTYRFIQQIKSIAPAPRSMTRANGSLWWVWAIAAFVCLILALFVTAWIGLILMLVELAIMFFELLKKKNAK